MAVVPEAAVINAIATLERAGFRVVPPSSDTVEVHANDVEDAIRFLEHLRPDLTTVRSRKELLVVELRRALETRRRGVQL